MRDAADYVRGNSEGASNATVMGTIKLLDNITDAVGFTIGRVNKNGIGNNDADTRVTIDLNDKNLTFTSDLKSNGVQVGKGKVMQFIRKSAASSSLVEIKNGKIAVANNATETFERLIRSYVDLKLTNVTLDGSNVKDQTHDADSALLAISAGNVTLDGTTNIITKPDANGQTYYALGVKPSKGNSSKYTNGVSLNVSVTTDSNIPNIAVYEWTGSNNEVSDFKDYVSITAASGNIGEIKFSEYARTHNALGQITLSGAKIGTFDIDSTAANNKYLVYGSTAGVTSSTYDSWTFGNVGWNAASNSTLNTEYNYVTTSESSGSSVPGTVLLNAKNVSDKRDLVLDTQAKIFGVPTSVTAGGLSSDYKLAALSYNNAKDAVIISSASDDSSILSGDYSVKSVLGDDSTVTGTGILASTVKKIDASGVNAKVVIGGNSLANEIYGGTSDQHIFLGAGSDTFYYSGGKDTIQDYTTSRDSDKDIVRLSGISPVTDAASISTNANNDLVITFGEKDILTFAGVAAAINGSADSAASLKAADDTYGRGVTVLGGNDTYVYKKGSVAQVGKGITLTGGYTASTYSPAANYSTIDASAVTLAAGLNITGDNQNTYIIGSDQGGTLYGATGNDTLKGSGKATFVNTFVYTDGKDVIENYQVGTDKVSLGSSVVFTGTKESSDKFTFNVNSGNSLTFKDFKPETDKITLVKDGADSGALTKDGVISGTTLKLFAGAKGDVDLKNSNLYGNTITTVDATDVKGQAVNLIAGTAGGTFSFAANNGRKDTFTLGDATSATINGYEAGKDKIDLGNATIASFTVNEAHDAVAAQEATADQEAVAAKPATPKNITLNLSGGKTVVINDIGNTDEVLIHDGSSKSDNAFGKNIFLANNVLADKKTPTSATVVGDPADHKFEATNTIKKIFVTGGVTNISVTAGDANNSTVNASLAGAGVSLIGGNKNDKFIGSSSADVFVYGKGKDVIQNYQTGASGDKVAFVAGGYSLAAATKIAVSDKSIKLTFGTGDVLNVKGTGLKSGGLNVGETKTTTTGEGDDAETTTSYEFKNYTFGKNAIISSVTPTGGTARNQATLTSAASGSVKTKNFTDVKYFDGSKVTKNLTFTGSAEGETLIGGTKKTVFKGGGGNDSLKGGSGKDTFFYAKGNTGDAVIANFAFVGQTNADNLKIANGTIQSITADGNNVKFSMSNGSKSNKSIIGSFTVQDAKTAEKEVVIKANSTYYWFATGETYKDSDGTTLTGLVTTKDKISNVNTSTYNVIDLTYSTNLVKSGVAKVTTTNKFSQS